MSFSRYRNFCLVVSGLLAALTLIPLGPLEVFESKTLDVRFWLRENLQKEPTESVVQRVILTASEVAALRRNELEAQDLAQRLGRWIEQHPECAAVGWEVATERSIAAGPWKQALETWQSASSAIRRDTRRAPLVTIAGVSSDDRQTLGSLPNAGWISLGMDVDGVVRRVPIVERSADGYSYSFLLRLLAAHDGVDDAGIEVRWGDAVILRGPYGAARRIPIDKQGRMLVNYQRRPATASLIFRELGDDTAPMGRRELVLLGVRDASFDKGRSTPLAVALPQTAILAEALDTVLTNRTVHRVGPLATLLLTWVLVFAAGVVMMRLTAWRSVAGGLGFLLLYFVLEKSAFILADVWLQFLKPMLALQLAVVIFPVFAYRMRTRRLLDEMRLLRKFDDMVLMHISGGLIVAGRQGHVIRHNPRAADLLGHEGESLHGTHIQELFAVSPAMLELLGQVMSKQSPASMRANRLPIGTRVAMPGKDGDDEGKILELEVALIDPELLESREHSDLPCYVLTFDDVTEDVAEAEHQAQRARLEAMGEVAAKLGHEIRNSLGGLQLYVEHVRDEFPPESQGQKVIHDMLREIESLYRKIDELRAYGSDPRPQLVRCDLKELLEEALTYATHRFGEKQIHTVLECEKDLPQVRVDRRQMREAFQNLINNAIDAAPEGGRVAVSAERLAESNGYPQGSFRIHVDDNGPGIAEDIRGQIFSLFFTTKQDTGTGLGLPMVKKVVENHGGAVNFRCEEEVGTRFTIVLPAGSEVGRET